MSLSPHANFLSTLPPERLAAWVARAGWINTARPDQLTPEGNWRIWLILAGRGWGKTRTGAEDAADFALWNPGVRVAIVAPTYADARDTCVEGDSGLLRIIPEKSIRKWNRSLGELLLQNGSRFKLFSADRPDRLRGPQHHRAWLDELAAWDRPEAFDQLMFGLRLGQNPQITITTTPKPTRLLKDLVERVGQDVVLTKGSTFDNAANLAPAALDQLRDLYGDTRMGRQELFADILEDADGALWTHEQIDALRVKTTPDLVRVVVAIDPAVSRTANSDETGIVAAGKGVDGLYYVLADCSGRYSPDGWARHAAALYRELNADRIVGEINEGGDLIERMLRLADEAMPFKPVRAIRSKAARALPIAALYERGKVRHVGLYPALEDQMCRFTQEGPDGKSPDRLDALVWALSDLSDTTQQAPRIRTL
jgi:phage terminase large subunit-like protein